MKRKVVKFIKEFYNVDAEFLWADTPNFSVFRNGRNNKWFCVLMEGLNKSKFGLNSDELVDVINLKCDPIMKYSFIDNQNIFPAYHMNKEYWISVFLDKNINFKDVKILIQASYNIIDKK